MEVKIGVQYAARELVIETNESADVIEKSVADALAAGGLLTLADAKGKRVFIAAEKITYVEIGAATQNAVGFRS